MTTPASPINTAKISGIRTLSFTTLAEVQAEADRLLAADRAGQLRHIGNWSLGQMFGHLAWWINAAYDGYPFKTPFLLKLLGPLMKSKILKGPPRYGMNLPKAPGGTYGIEPRPTEDGHARLTAALTRLEKSPPTAPNPVFGKMTPNEWKLLHIRHAEAHMGFQIPS